MSRTRYLAVAAAVATLGVRFFWPANEVPPLVAGPISVSYDPAALRLTAIVTVRNDGDRPIVAFVTRDVFIDSQKLLSSDQSQQSSRTELGAKQSSPVTFIVQGDTAVAAWNGVRLLEITVNAVYSADEKSNCHFTFMGRFYPELKEIGRVSSTTSPSSCRRRRT
jgi:hypothetical protein